MTTKANVYEMITSLGNVLGQELDQEHTTELQRNLTALSIRFF